jgi:hypothetical protein
MKPIKIENCVERLVAGIVEPIMSPEYDVVFLCQDKPEPFFIQTLHVQCIKIVGDKLHLSYNKEFFKQIKIIESHLRNYLTKYNNNIKEQQDLYSLYDAFNISYDEKLYKYQNVRFDTSTGLAFVDCPDLLLYNQDKEPINILNMQNKYHFSARFLLYFKIDHEENEIQLCAKQMQFKNDYQNYINEAVLTGSEAEFVDVDINTMD